MIKKSQEFKNSSKEKENTLFEKDKMMGNGKKRLETEIWDVMIM